MNTQNNTIKNIFIALVLILVAFGVGFGIKSYIDLQKEQEELKEELEDLREEKEDKEDKEEQEREEENDNDVKDDDSQDYNMGYSTKEFKEISPLDIKKLSKDKTIVVWVGRQSCGYCAAYAPYIEEAAEEYGITAYYIDLATLVNFEVEQPYITDEEGFNILSELPGEGEWDTFAAENVGGTPLTLIIKNNKVVGGISGYTETDNIINAFKDAGLKKN